MYGAIRFKLLKKDTDKVSLPLFNHVQFSGQQVPEIPVLKESVDFVNKLHNHDPLNTCERDK